MSKKAADQINELLQGERAAASTYRQALDKVGTDARADGLRLNQKDHFDAVMELKKYVKIEGESPADDSGMWGGFAKTVMGTAKLFGDQAALKALKEGEEHGLKEYQNLVENSEVSPDLRNFVRATMIPNQNSHISRIDSIMNNMQ